MIFLSENWDLPIQAPKMSELFKPCSYPLGGLTFFLFLCLIFISKCCRTCSVCIGQVLRFLFPAWLMLPPGSCNKELYLPNSVFFPSSLILENEEIALNEKNISLRQMKSLQNFSTNTWCLAKLEANGKRILYWQEWGKFHNRDCCRDCCCACLLTDSLSIKILMNGAKMMVFEYSKLFCFSHKCGY